MKKKFKFKRFLKIETPLQTKEREEKEKNIQKLIAFIIWLFCMGFIVWFIFSWVRALFFI